MKNVVTLAMCLLLVPMFAGSAFAQDETRAEISLGWRYYPMTLKNVVDPFELTDRKIIRGGILHRGSLGQRRDR